MRIVAPTHSLFYINVNYFRDELTQMCPLNDSMRKATLCDMCKTNYACFLKCGSCCARNKERQKVERGKVLNEAKIIVNRDSENDIENESLATSSKEKRQFRAVILDCTRCNFIDESGAKCLKEIVDTYAKENVQILLTNCNGNVLFVSFFKFSAIQY